jgi:hypothetical protein
VPTFILGKWAFGQFCEVYAHFWLEFRSVFGRFWEKKWPFAHFLPTFKNKSGLGKTQYSCGFAGFLPTFPLFSLI